MKKHNLNNLKFGKLLVVSEAEKSPRGHSRWNCVCDCGNTCVRTGTSLERSENSSCGCFRLHGKNSPLWGGSGDISASWFHNVIYRAASGRKSRSNIVKQLEITVEDIWELFLKQDKKCALTGLELTFPIKNTAVESKKSTASLDRIDSTKGYVLDNVQWVHKSINLMKNIYSQEHFIKMCKLVAKNNTDGCEVK
jgi:hypothetical protein